MKMKATKARELDQQEQHEIKKNEPINSDFLKREWEWKQKDSYWINWEQQTWVIRIEAT